MADLNELRDIARKFTSERDWEQFHNPKDLGVALSIEVAEVLEHFRFKTNKEIEKYLKTNRKKLGHELADVLWFLVRLSDVCDIDLTEAFMEKEKITEKKYPAEKVKGKPDKYTVYK